MPGAAWITILLFVFPYVAGMTGHIYQLLLFETGSYEFLTWADLKLQSLQSQPLG
jgi:hypothetical protein